MAPAAETARLLHDHARRASAYGANGGGGGGRGHITGGTSGSRGFDRARGHAVGGAGDSKIRGSDSGERVTDDTAAVLAHFPFDHPASPTYHLHSIGALWARGHTPQEQLAALTSVPLREFYERQNEQLEVFRQAAERHPCMSSADALFLVRLAEKDAPRRPTDEEVGASAVLKDERVDRAVILSNICNIFLLFAQVYAFAASGSLAMMATFLDAFLDVVSGFVILFTWWIKRTAKDKHRYPVGRARLEPLGVMVMACLMTAATLSTIKESAETLLAGPERSSLVGLTPAVTAIIGIALVTKGLLFLYCRDSDDVSVLALAEDHRNDVLSNAASIVTIYLAEHYFWWLDPCGGIFISCLIIRNWVRHTMEHVDNLLSKTASREVINCIVFMACNHSPDLRMVDTVRAYHVGNGIFVEIDIVLDSDLPLWRAHDIGESLQMRVEQVDGIERCFVHLDYESDHSPNLEHKEI